MHHASPSGPGSCSEDGPTVRPFLKDSLKKPGSTGVLLLSCRCAARYSTATLSPYSGAPEGDLAAAGEETQLTGEPSG